MEINKIKEIHESIFSVMLNPCDLSILPHIINPSIEYIWVMDHWPNPYVEWWDTNISISKTTSTSLAINRLRYDFQIKTSESNKILNSLVQYPEGITLYQSDNLKPATLNLSKEINTNYKKLLQNGFYLKFYQPHANEYSQIVCRDKKHLESLMQSKYVTG